MREESVSTAVMKMAPAMGGATIAGLTMNEWAAVATIIYVIAQTGLLLPKYWAWLRGKLAERKQA